MKKIISLLLVALTFVACSKDDEPNENSTTKQVNEIAKVLNGTFVGTKTSLNVLETHEITFTPYSTPKSEEWYNSTTSITKNVLMFGECDVKKYYNDHLLETSKHWKYSIEVAYTGAQTRLNFYPDVYGLTETHDITITGANSFVFDDITFKKQ